MLKHVYDTESDIWSQYDCQKRPEIFTPVNIVGTQRNKMVFCCNETATPFWEFHIFICCTSKTEG